MFNIRLIHQFDLVASAYCVYVWRNNGYVLDYPQLFVKYDDAVNFMRETYGTDIKPWTDDEKSWVFVDNNNNFFYIGLVNTYGRR